MSQPQPAGPEHLRLLCYVGLVAFVVAQAQMGMLLPSLLVALMGALSIGMRLRHGPVEFLGVFALGEILILRVGFPPPAEMAPRGYVVRPPDLLLCVAIAAFVSVNFRLLGVWYPLLPKDRRRAEAKTQMRRAGQITPEELFTIIVLLPVWTALGQLISQALFRFGPELAYDTRWGQILVLVWLLAIGVGLARMILTYWRWRQLSPNAARVLLLSEFWQDTRGEQRRIERWRAWRVRRDERISSWEK